MAGGQKTHFILDTIISAFNLFPGKKTKAGALMQLGVVFGMAYNGAAAAWGWPPIPAEYLGYGQLGASTLIGVGAANQPANAGK